MTNFVLHVSCCPSAALHNYMRVAHCMRCLPYVLLTQTPHVACAYFRSLFPLPLEGRVYAELMRKHDARLHARSASNSLLNPKPAVSSSTPLPPSSFPSPHTVVPATNSLLPPETPAGSTLFDQRLPTPGPKLEAGPWPYLALWFDGGSRGNPGTAGSGAILRIAGSEPLGCHLPAPITSALLYLPPPPPPPPPLSTYPLLFLHHHP